MDDLVSMLPIMQSALEVIQVAERRTLVRDFIVFVKEMSEQLNEYATRRTRGEYGVSLLTKCVLTYGLVFFILENWYNSKKSEVDALRRKSTRLKQNIDLAITVDIKEEQFLAEGERMLNRIKPLARSSFDPDPKNCCMPDTRVNLIEGLVSFAVSENTSKRLFLLSGIAGCGKSAVATSVANLLYRRDCLLGSFFFHRDSEKMRISANLLHTIAYSMALRHAPYKKALIEVLKKDAMIEDQGLSIQFDALLRKPLSEMLKISSTNTIRKNLTR
jgi:hypothetical protein